MIKDCRNCGKGFDSSRNNKIHCSVECRIEFMRKRDIFRMQNNPNRKHKALEYTRKHRENNPWYYTWKSCADYDKSRGWVNNLTVEFVKEITTNPCEYCGEEEMRRGLDRIDNGKAHNKDNVKCACPRCNYIKNDMPYKLWEYLIPGIRKAREAGIAQTYEKFAKGFIKPRK